MLGQQGLHFGRDMRRPTLSQRTPAAEPPQLPELKIPKEVAFVSTGGGCRLLIAVSQPRGRGWGSPVGRLPAKLVEVELNIKQELERTAVPGLLEREDQRLCSVPAAC